MAVPKKDDRRVRMMPGQEPYTPEEWEEVKRRVHDAGLSDPGEDAEKSA